LLGLEAQTLALPRPNNVDGNIYVPVIDDRIVTRHATTALLITSGRHAAHVTALCVAAGPTNILNYR